METIIKQICEKNTHRYFKTAPEIADIFRRFSIWCLMEYYEYFESGLDNEGNYQFFDMQGNEITFNNIFDYWWNEIKDK